jgi:hypothetical protein
MVMAENSPTPAEPSSQSDLLFRRIVAVSMALCLGLTYGWLAGFVRESDGNLTFHWQWMVLVWALIGIGSSIYFWRCIWPPPNRPEATRKQIVAGSIVLGVPGLWWLIFPLRSLSGQHFWQVMEGLTVAAIVLTLGAFMIIRLGKAFENDDEADPNAPSHKEVKK